MELDVKLRLSWKAAPCSKVETVTRWIGRVETDKEKRIRKAKNAASTKRKDETINEYLERYAAMQSKESPEDMTRVDQYMVLTWESGGVERKVNPQKVTEALMGINSQDDMIQFFKEFGPLFDGNEIDTGKALATIYGMQLLLLITRNESDGEMLLESLKQAVKAQPDVKRWSTETPYCHAFCSRLVPAQRGAWPYFKVPDTWPVAPADVQKYLKEEILRNTATKMNQLKAGLGKKGVFVKPKNMLDYIMAWNVMYKKKDSTTLKQSVLTCFRVYKKRGKVTDDEYEAAKTAVNEAWESKVRDREELNRYAGEAIENLRHTKEVQS